MIILDAHCDTITKIMDTNENLLKNSCHIDLVRMKEINNSVQFFAAFIDPMKSNGCPMKLAIKIIDKFHEQIELYRDEVSYCTNYEGIILTLDSKKVAAILTIEGGDCLEGELSALRMFYKLGVRSLVLTWNHRNEIADGIGESTNGGLTSFGRKVIREMNELGMIIDVSHLSEKGFWDVIELTKDPIIASHSNAKHICKHRRNLSNQQIMAIKENGGVIGINFYPFFLSDSGNANIKDILLHIEHIAELTGEDHLGFGADFDGIDISPVDIHGIQDMGNIYNELMKLNYSQSFIEKIAGQNFLRVIKEIC
jgi:membrane dipeptidase